MMRMRNQTPNQQRKSIIRTSHHSWNIENQFNNDLKRSYISLALDAMQQGFTNVDDYIDVKLKNKNRFFQVKDNNFVSNKKKIDYNLNSNDFIKNKNMIKFGNNQNIFRRY